MVHGLLLCKDFSASLAMCLATLPRKWFENYLPMRRWNFIKFGQNLVETWSKPVTPPNSLQFTSQNIFYGSPVAEMGGRAFLLSFSRWFALCAFYGGPLIKRNGQDCNKPFCMFAINCYTLTLSFWQAYNILVDFICTNPILCQDVNSRWDHWPLYHKHTRLAYDGYQRIHLSLRCVP